jgi:hypothetical protein
MTNSPALANVGRGRLIALSRTEKLSDGHLKIGTF